MRDDFQEMVSDGLKKISYGLKEIAKHMEALLEADFHAAPASKSTEKPVKKRSPAKQKKQTDTEIVFDIIAGADEGVNTARLSQETGFDKKKIRYTVQNLKKQNRIRTKRWGVYVANR